MNRRNYFWSFALAMGLLAMFGCAERSRDFSMAAVDSAALPEPGDLVDTWVGLGDDGGLFRLVLDSERKGSCAIVAYDGGLIGAYKNANWQLNERRVTMDLAPLTKGSYPIAISASFVGLVRLTVNEPDSGWTEQAELHRETNLLMRLSRAKEYLTSPPAIGQK